MITFKIRLQIASIANGLKKEEEIPDYSSDMSWIRFDPEPASVASSTLLPHEWTRPKAVRPDS